jgi:hypothetical protein
VTQAADSVGRRAADSRGPAAQPAELAEHLAELHSALEAAECSAVLRQSDCCVKAAHSVSAQVGPSRVELQLAARAWRPDLAAD